MIIFGGFDNGTVLNDTWALDLSGSLAWSELMPNGSPPGKRAGHAAVYDPVRDQMLIFGSYDSYYPSDVWSLSLSDVPTWEELVPGGTPPIPRGWGRSATYDPVRDLVVVFGGDALELALTDTPTWNPLSLAGTQQIGGGLHTAIRDPLRDRIVMYAGSGEGVWALIWSDVATSTLISLVRSHAEPGYARVDWLAGENRNLAATVYRRTDVDPWAAVGQVSTDGTGHLTFEDFTVVAGSRYGYRLGIVRDGAEAMLGETWVEVRREVGFTLAGARPNPASDGLRVAFSLPDNARASLELLDLAGRRVFSNEVGALGRGNHVVEFGRGRNLTPGLYFLRLSKPDQLLTERVTVVR